MLTSVNSKTGNTISRIPSRTLNASEPFTNLADFGFTTEPDAVGHYGAREWNSSLKLDPVNFPGGYTVDACAFSGNNCDAANNQADLFSGTFELTFAGGYQLDRSQQLR